MSNAILYRMASGIPGACSREENKTIEPVPFGTTPFTAYGLPYKYSSGTIVPVGSGDLAAAVAGCLVRPYPSSSSGTALGNATPPTSGIANGLKRGYMTVKCNAGTPALGVKVYIRTANASGAKVVGGIEAAAEQSVAGGVITGTGTGTIAATVAEGVKPGTWSLMLQTTSGTSKVTVIDPDGNRLADATVGAAYSHGGLSFTITAAGTMTAGDSFAPVVSVNTIAPAGWYFNGSADADGNAEIAVNI